MAWIRCTGNTGGSLKARTASGAIATFETNMADVLQEVKCEINATGGNGTPDNPNPINGFTEANITRCGVNLWDEETEKGTYDDDGEKVPSNLILRNVNPFKVPTGGSIYISTPANGIIFWYTQDMTFISKEDFFTAGVKSVPNNAVWANFRMTSGYGVVYNNDISFNLPSTNTTYHPYTGNTYTIAFGQTVYGGLLDVTRGKLTVTFLEFDLGTLTPVMYTVTEGNLFRYALDSLKPLTSDYDVTKILCSNYPSVASALRANKTLSQVSNLLRFDIIDNDYNDAISMKTAMNGVQVVYPLATPFDIDLTAQQIEALHGINNVWHDGNGDTKVKYLEVVRN